MGKCVYFAVRKTAAAADLREGMFALKALHEGKLVKAAESARRHNDRDYQKSLANTAFHAALSSCMVSASIVGYLITPGTLPWQMKVVLWVSVGLTAYSYYKVRTLNSVYFEGDRNE